MFTTPRGCSVPTVSANAAWGETGCCLKECCLSAEVERLRLCQWLENLRIPLPFLNSPFP